MQLFILLTREHSNHAPLTVCLSVCLSVCLHDKTKTAETKIAKLDTEIVHHATSPTYQRSKFKVRVTR